MFFAIIPAVVFGWALGANDAANVYGTAVTSGLVKYRLAVVLSAIFILIGALLEGSRGLETISSVSSQTLITASVSTIGAAISMTLMTYLGIPSSSSQAMMGAILGIGILNSTVDWSVLTKVVICFPTVYITLLLKVSTPRAILSPPTSAATSRDIIPAKGPVTFATLFAPKA